MLVSAVLSDASADPGDRLTLGFSGDVLLAAGTLLTDADFTLSAGASLGQVSAAPVRVHARSIEITLGSGVQLSTGTTSIALASDQDAVLAASGTRLTDTNAVTLGTSDGDRPVVSMLTANSVPNVLNGAGSAGGTLLVGRFGFSLEAEYSDTTSAIDTSKVYLTADKSVRVAGQDRIPGTNLAPLLAGTIGATNAGWTFGSSDALPVGTTVLTFSVTDTTGNVSVPVTLSLRSIDTTTTLLPFESGQLWYLDVTRDVDTYAQSGTTLQITAPATPNGTADFLEELLILGLRSPTPLTNVSGGKDSNQVALELLQNEILAQLALLYDGTQVSFTFTAPGSFPSGQVVVPYASHGFSQIAIGSNSVDKGASAGTTPDTSPLGLAIYDPNNKTQEDDTGLSPPYRLGVFPMTLIQTLINAPANAFRTRFDPFLRNRGTPIGEDAGDAARLVNLLAQGSPGDSRETQMQTAIDDYARFLAVVIAHECGHSVGLVADGAQPQGLFGGIAGLGGSSGHIDLSGTGVFPSGAQEVMNASISFTRSLSSETGFNPLIASYLRMTGLYDAALSARLGEGSAAPPVLATELDEPIRYDLAWREATHVAIARVEQRGLRQILHVEQMLKGPSRPHLRLISLEHTGAHERVHVRGEPWLVFLRAHDDGAALLQHPGVQTPLESEEHRNTLLSALRAIDALQAAPRSSLLAQRASAVLALALEFEQREARAASALLAALHEAPEIWTHLPGSPLLDLAANPAAAPALRRAALALGSEIAPFASLPAIRSQLTAPDAPRYARSATAALQRALPGQELPLLQSLGGPGSAQRDAMLIAIDQLGTLAAWRTLDLLQHDLRFGPAIRRLRLRQR